MGKKQKVWNEIKQRSTQRDVGPEKLSPPYLGVDRIAKIEINQVAEIVWPNRPQVKEII